MVINGDDEWWLMVINGDFLLKLEHWLLCQTLVSGKDCECSLPIVSTYEFELQTNFKIYFNHRKTFWSKIQNIFQSWLGLFVTFVSLQALLTAVFRIRIAQSPWDDRRVRETASFSCKAKCWWQCLSVAFRLKTLKRLAYDWCMSQGVDFEHLRKPSAKSMLNVMLCHIPQGH